MTASEVKKNLEEYLESLRIFIEETEDWPYYWIHNEEVQEALEKGCRFKAVPSGDKWVNIHAYDSDGIEESGFPINRCIQKIETFQRDTAKLVTQWKGRILEARIEELEGSINSYQSFIKRAEDKLRELRG